MSRPAAPPERRATLTQIGRRIAARRRELGWHQADLAAAMGVARSTVGFWETGVADPGSWRLPRIARLLRVSVASLLAEVTPETVIAPVAPVASRKTAGQGITDRS